MATRARAGQSGPYSRRPIVAVMVVAVVVAWSRSMPTGPILYLVGCLLGGCFFPENAYLTMTGEPKQPLFQIAQFSSGFSKQLLHPKANGLLSWAPPPEPGGAARWAKLYTVQVSSLVALFVTLCVALIPQGFWWTPIVTAPFIYAMVKAIASVRRGNAPPTSINLVEALPKIPTFSKKQLSLVDQYKRLVNNDDDDD